MKVLSRFSAPVLAVFGVLAILSARAVPAPQTPDNERTRLPVAAAKIKVEVNLVLVDASVCGAGGKPIGDLTRADLRLYEDGVEQEIRFFSHEELPIALALVIDGSTSVAAALDELRQGALDALGLLGPHDEVAVFAFTEKPQQVQALTTDRPAIVEALYSILPGGGTTINDALQAAALYLQREAQDRRHAVILLSDNAPQDQGTITEAQVVRAALESGTPIYSIKGGFLELSKLHSLLHLGLDFRSVERICHATGGQMIDTRRGRSAASAMTDIITWLKQGYTLGYTSTNRHQDGGYRKIEVRLAGRQGKYAIFARQGYYAPVRSTFQDPSH